MTQAQVRAARRKVRLRYKRPPQRSVGEAVEQERRRGAREALRAKKGTKK